MVVGRKGSFGEVVYSPDACWPIDTTYYINSETTTADLRWLFYRLRALGLKDLNRAAAVPGLNRDDAYARRLLLPPIEEQRRIAAVLDAADERAMELLHGLRVGTADIAATGYRARPLDADELPGDVWTTLRRYRVQMSRHIAGG